jgi:hypothetical protein
MRQFFPAPGRAFIRRRHAGLADGRAADGPQVGAFTGADPGDRDTRRRLAGLLGGASACLVVTLGLAGVAEAVVAGPVNNPPAAPHGVIAFPQRDFVSASGYDINAKFTVEVFHGASTTASGRASGITPAEDPGTPGLGLIEVNHPGGACWGNNGDTLAVTPDIHPGDRVRIMNEATGAADETTVSNVTAKRPVQTAAGTVQIHGTAKTADGSPIDIAQLEQRLVSPGNLFAANGRRTLRAASALGSDGTLSYDTPGGTNWTATYTGLSSDDVTRALEAESRIMWLGSDPAAAVEATVFEIGGGAVAGPAAPCTAPLEKLPPPPGSETTPPTTPAGLTATANKSTVTLSWKASTDNVGVTDYGVYRNGVAIATVQNPDGTAPAPVTFDDKNVPPGSYTYTVDAGDAVGNRSPMSNEAPGTTTINPAPPAGNVPPVAPHSLIAFPARDFISATGYTAGTSYTFSVVRAGNTIATSTPVIADSTGVVEVNHPGGGCWEGVTPDIRPGDAVRITGPGGVSDQTTVAGVTAERPIVTAVDPVTGGGTIEVHGTARNSAGNQIPLDQIEQRLIAGNDLFDLNGRRSIRAGAGLDGTLAYDAANSVKWTARYTVQTPNDLARGVGGRSTSGTLFPGAESRMLWLGSTPAAGVELTIYENGPAVAGGPAAGIGGCTSGSPEKGVAGALLSAAPQFATTAVGGASAAQDVTIKNSGDAALHITRAYLAGLNPSDYAITANGADGAILAPGAAATVSVSFRPKSSGTRQANLSFADDAANTTDQTVELLASTPVDTTPVATAPVQSLAAGQTITNAAGKADSAIAIDLRWTATGSRSELQMATGPGTAQLGAFGAPPVGTALPDGATSTTVNLKMGGPNGTAYRFRTRSCNGTTCGAWTVGPAFTLEAADDSGIAAALFKGAWTVDTTVAGAYGGTVRWTAGSGTATIVSAVQFTVSGNAAWVSTMGPDRGVAEVQVDGGKPDVIDLYSPTMQPARVAWARDALPPGPHTVTVKVLGKKSTLNPAPCTTGSRCARVDVDAGVVIR